MISSLRKENNSIFDNVNNQSIYKNLLVYKRCIQSIFHRYFFQFLFYFFVFKVFINNCL